MRCLAGDPQVETVESAELSQRGQVDVQETVGRKSEVRKLEHAEQFEADDLAAEQREDEDGVADDLCGLQHHLHLVGHVALLGRVEQGWCGRIVADVQSLTRSEEQLDGLVGDVASVLGVHLDQRVVLRDAGDGHILVEDVDVPRYLTEREARSTHCGLEAVAAFLLDGHELALDEHGLVADCGFSRAHVVLLHDTAGRAAIVGVGVAVIALFAQ